MGQFKITVYDANGIQKTTASTVPAGLITGTVALANGGTAANLSATGGTSQFVKQAGAGAAFTVGTITGAEILSPLTSSLVSPPPIGTTIPNSGWFSNLRVLIGGFFGTFTHSNTADRLYTFQDSSDTIVGRATTDTLTNKTLTSPTVNTPTISGGTIDNTPVGTTTRALGYFSALREYIGGFAAIFTHANTADRTYNFPDYNGTIATLAGTETFTNKSISASQINSGTLALARGGANADLSATGGANFYIKQSSSGASLTSSLAGADLLIPRTSLSGSSQVISIPTQAFNTLFLLLEIRSAVVATTDTGQIQLGDATLDTTAANYLTYRMVHSGTTPTQTAVENLGTVAQVRFSVPGASATASFTSFTLIVINNYSTSSRIKQVRIENGYAISSATGNVAEETATGYWLNTSKALTQISVSCNGGNLASPSAYQLFGLGVP